MFCHNCGNTLESSHKYCTKCGQQVLSSANPSGTEGSHPMNDEPSVESNNIPSELIRLHAAIKSCLSSSNDSASDILIELLESIVTTREAGIKLVEQFYQYYQINLIFQLSEISTAYLEQKRYLKRFIDFEIVEKDFPYAFKEESLEVLKPIQEILITKPRGGFSFRTVFILIGLLAIAYYIYAPDLGLPEKFVSNKAPTYSTQDNISVGNFEYLITRYEFYKKANGEKYLKVYLSITNQSNEARYAVASLFRLIDDDGKTYEYSIEEGTNISLQGETELFLMQLNPNIRKSGFIVFEIPERKRYFLEFSGGIWNNETERVLIE